MKPDKIHDALNHIDDELIESADKIRSAPRTIRLGYTRTLALAATVFVMLVVTLIFARSIASDLTSDGAVGLDVTTDIVDATDTGNKGDDDLDGSPGDMNVGVTVPKRVIDESYKPSKLNSPIDYFCHDGRIYVPYAEIVYRPYDEVVGEKLGTVTNVFDTEPYGDYYGELHGNMSFDVYKMKDYDESFMLAVDVDGSYYVFINDNDLTLKTGADILRDRFKLEGGYTSVSMQYYQGMWNERLQKQYYEIIEEFIEAMCDAPVVSPDSADISGSLCLAMLRFEHDCGTLFSLQLYNGGYVSVLLGRNAVLIQLDEDVFGMYIDKLGHMKFNPDSFVAGIPTPPIERFAFYHKIFPTSTYLYFYSDAHYWPEELMDEDVRYDKSSVKAYYYDANNSDKGIGTVTFSLPEDFDTSYDHVTPVYTHGGGGSCECAVVFRFDYADESVYAEFNNFSWTNDILIFEYAGVVDEELVQKSMKNAMSKIEE